MVARPTARAHARASGGAAARVATARRLASRGRPHRLLDERDDHGRHRRGPHGAGLPQPRDHRGGDDRGNSRQRPEWSRRDRPAGRRRDGLGSGVPARRGGPPLRVGLLRHRLATAPAGAVKGLRATAVAQAGLSPCSSRPARTKPAAARAYARQRCRRGSGQVRLGLGDRVRPVVEDLRAQGRVGARPQRIARCSSSPAPPEAITGTPTAPADRAGQREVVAVVRAVAIHARQQDLPRAALDALARPFDHVAPGRRAPAGEIGLP